MRSRAPAMTQEEALALAVCCMMLSGSRTASRMSALAFEKTRLNTPMLVVEQRGRNGRNGYVSQAV